MVVQTEEPRLWFGVPRWVLAALLFVVVGYAALEWLLRAQQNAVHWWANAGWTLISLTAAIKAWRTSSRARHRGHAGAFRFFALGSFAWFLGMLEWSYFELVLGVFTPFPTWAELGFLGLAPLFMAGFFAYGNSESENRFSLKTLGDLGILIASWTMVGGVLYVSAARAGNSLHYLVVALGYPILHLTALSYALVVLWQREWGAERGVMLWLLAGMAALALVTTLYGHSLLARTYEAGHSLDVWWIITFACVIAASYRQDALTEDAPYRAARTAPVVDALVPSIALVFVVGVTYAYRDQWVAELDGLFLAAGVVLVVSLAARALGAQRIETELRRGHEAKTQELVQAQKMQALGTLASGIAHDFNNLLSGMLGGLGLLRRMDELPAQASSYLDLMEQSMLRAADLSKRLRSLSRTQSGSRVAFEPTALARRVAALLERGVSGSRRIDVELPTTPTGAFIGDVGMLEQGILNLGLNAGHATGDAGTITISVALRADETGRHSYQGEYLVFGVADDGCGIPEEIQARVFEPFFTTREQEQGTGLGLAMVHAVAEEHGGFVVLRSELDVGTDVEIWIPARPATESMEPGHFNYASLPMGTERVLVVDDRDGPLLAAKSVLEACGYEVRIAWSAADGLEHYAREGADAIVTDAVMPDMGGRAFLVELRRRGFHGPAVLMSGHHQEAEDRGDFYAVLTKPFDAPTLATTVREALDASAGERTLTA